MVDKKVVIKTIKKMMNSGIEDEVIISTLSDLGLSRQESEELISNAKENSAETLAVEEAGPKEETPETGSKEYDIDSVIKKTSDRIKNHLAGKEQSDSLKEQTTRIELEEQDGKLNELHKKMDSVHGNSSSGFLDLKKKISVIEKDVSEIKNDLKDFKAKINAMHDIMKKILETERKLLTKK